MNEYNIFWSAITGVISYFSADVQQLYKMFPDPNASTSYALEEKEKSHIQILEKAYAALKNSGSDARFTFTDDTSDHMSLSKSEVKFLLDAAKNSIDRKRRQEGFLHIMAFGHLVALFDAAIIDFVTELYKNYPMTMIPVEKGAPLPSMNYLDILNSNDLDDVKNEMIEREVLAFGFKSIREQLNFFSKIINHNYFDQKVAKVQIEDLHNPELIGAIIEMREIRNLHMHSKGKVNKLFKKKLNEYAEEINTKQKDKKLQVQHFNFPSRYFSVGEYAHIDAQYLYKSIENCTHILNAIRNALLDKFISKDEQELLIKKNQEYWEKRRSSEVGNNN